MTPTISTTPILQLASGDRLFTKSTSLLALLGKKVSLQADLKKALIVGDAVRIALLQFQIHKINNSK